MANEQHLAIFKQGVEKWNEWRENEENKKIRPDLSEVDLSGLKNLFEINLYGTYLFKTILSGADLRKANLHEAILHETILRGADLSEANLSGAILLNANLERAKLNGCRVYGISTWNLILDKAEQNDLIITPPEEATVTVNSLNAAQFVYLIMHNKEISQVIDTTTSKVVLILGRFSSERKAVLYAIHKALRENYNYVPIIFDFDPPKNQTTTETVQFLASMARFVIADLTYPSSIPQELTAIIPKSPSLPIQPLLLIERKPKYLNDISANLSESIPLGERKLEYSMFRDWRPYRWVLPIFYYKNEEHLITNLEKSVIQPAINWKSRQKLLEDITEELKVVSEEKEKLQRKYDELQKELEAFKSQPKS